MGTFVGRLEIETALQRVGELLDSEGEHYSIVVIGGAALNLLRLVERTTRDVDVLAFAGEQDATRGVSLTAPPDPLPPAFVRAIRIVGQDSNLAEGWLNTEPALQLRTGLPPGFEKRLTWRDFAGLRVGLAGRRDLIYLKLFAAADGDKRHVHDLITLNPTDEELSAAAVWTKGQDANAKEFPKIVDSVVRHVRESR